jgi:hypothetical protein
MVDARKRRGVGDLTARVVAELGALAWETAYARWTHAGDSNAFGDLARSALGEVRAATALA